MTAGVQVGAISPEIKLNGVFLAQNILDYLITVKIERGLAMPGRATLRFDDPGYNVSTGGGFTPGARVEFATGDALLFAGEVTGVSLENRRQSIDFVVTIDDLAYRMALGTKVRTFTKSSVGEVVNKIVGEYGLRAQLQSTPGQIPYLMQAGSDLDFLSQLADQVGFDWWVEDRTFNFSAPKMASPVALTLGDQLTEFDVRTTTLHPGETTITGWWAGQKQEVSGTAALTMAQLKPTADLVSPFVTSAKLNGFSKLTYAGASPANQQDANNIADRLAQQWVSQAVTARGVTLANAAIKPGTSVAIASAGPASGTYYVSEVQHSYSRNGFQTRFTAGDRRPSALVDNLGGTAGSGGLGSALVIGIVSSVGGTEANSEGTVKVKYPSLGGSVDSNWARVATIGGGAKRGMTFLPEVNDEVLVGFQGGDLRQPVVLGGLFNNKDTAIDFGVKSGVVQRRRITSRLGHFIEFGDDTADDQQHIGLTLAGGKHILKLGKKGLEGTVPQGVPVKIQAGNSSIQVTDNGDITLEGGKITLKARTDIELSAVNVVLKGQAKVEASGAQIAIKANAQAEVSAGGQVTIKGAMVMIN